MGAEPPPVADASPASPSDHPIHDDAAAGRRDLIEAGGGGYSVVEYDPGGAPIIVGRIMPLGGLFRAYQYDNQGHVTISATFHSLKEAQAVFVESKEPHGDPNALGTIDWIALGLLTLTAVLGVSTAVVAGLRPVTDQAVTLGNDTFTASVLAGIAGLFVGIGALGTSQGRPKWPGILALFSPVVAVVCWVLAFAAAAGLT